MSFLGVTRYSVTVKKIRVENLKLVFIFIYIIIYINIIIILWKMA